MRQVTLIMNASIDGFVVAPDGFFPKGLPEESAELKRWKLDRISKAGAHLMGRVAYEEMGPFWQKSNDAYAAPMNDIPKVVFSKSLKVADWPTTTIASGDMAEEVAALKAKSGGELIAWGGAKFAQSMTGAGLVDQYVIITRQTAYGAGKPMFLNLATPMQFKLLAATNFDDGTVLRIYNPQK